MHPFFHFVLVWNLKLCSKCFSTQVLSYHLQNNKLIIMTFNHFKVWYFIKAVVFCFVGTLEQLPHLHRWGAIHPLIILSMSDLYLKQVVCFIQLFLSIMSQHLASHHITIQMEILLPLQVVWGESYFYAEVSLYYFIL